MARFRRHPPAWRVCSDALVLRMKARVIGRQHPGAGEQEPAATQSMPIPTAAKPARVQGTCGPARRREQGKRPEREIGSRAQAPHVVGAASPSERLASRRRSKTPHSGHMPSPRQPAEFIAALGAGVGSWAYSCFGHRARDQAAAYPAEHIVIKG